MERAIRGGRQRVYPAFLADDPTAPYVRLEVEDGLDKVLVYIHAVNARRLGVELMTAADSALKRSSPSPQKRGKR